MNKQLFPWILVAILSLLIVTFFVVWSGSDVMTGESQDASSFDEGSEEQEIMQRIEGEQAETQAESDDEFLELTGEDEE